MLNSNAKWVLTSQLFSNIGNGMNMIAISSILYIETGSILSFGLVLVIDNVMSVILQFLSGSVVDRGNPKKILILCDVLRGTFICLAYFILYTGFEQFIIYMSIVFISFAKPFNRSASFSIAPAVAKGEALYKFNGYNSMFIQVGQLIGIAIVGVIIQFFGAKLAFFLHGIAFFLSAAAIWRAKVPVIEKIQKRLGESVMQGFRRDWTEMFRMFKKNQTLLFHIILCSGDALVIAMINLLLVPMVYNWYNNNMFYLSAFDGGFAIGGVIAVSLVIWIKQRIDEVNIISISLFGQAVILACMGLYHNPIVTIILMFLMGILNTFSVVVFSSRLQSRVSGPFKGRLASVRSLFTSVLIAIIIPTISSLAYISLNLVFLVGALICFCFFITTFILTRKRIFGHALLGIYEKVKKIA